MKLKLKDKVMVISGKDKGRTGEIVAVLRGKNQVVVSDVNIVKRHTKPNRDNPRGGILDVTKPLDASKVMVLDPTSGKPARIGYTVSKTGKKERIFKVSKFKNKKIDKPTDKTRKTKS